MSAGAYVLAGSMILNVCGFGFHAVASRRLGVAEYGSLYALISMYLLAILPASLFAPVVSRYAAEFGALHDDAHMRGLIGNIARVFGALAIVYVVVSFVFSGHIAAYLHVPAWSVPIVGVMSGAGVLSLTLRAVAQGIHEYFAYAVSSAAEGILKLAFVLLLGLGALTIFGGTLAFTLGIAGGMVAMVIPLYLRYRGIESARMSIDWKRVVASTAGAAALATTTVVMGSLDVVIVKHAFSAHEAGLYSAASLGGKILLYFVGFVPGVLIPQATHRHARGEQTRQTLALAIGFIVIVGACGVIAYQFGGQILLHALYGTQFDAAKPLLVGYGAAMALLAVSSALASYGIATHRLAFVWPLAIGTLLTLLAIAFVHPTPAIVVGEMVIGNAVIAVSVALSLGVAHLARSGGRP